MVADQGKSIVHWGSDHSRKIACPCVRDGEESTWAVPGKEAKSRETFHSYISNDFVYHPSCFNLSLHHQDQQHRVPYALLLIEKSLRMNNNLKNSQFSSRFKFGAHLDATAASGEKADFGSPKGDGSSDWSFAATAAAAAAAAAAEAEAAPASRHTMNSMAARTSPRQRCRRASTSARRRPGKTRRRTSTGDRW